MDGLHQLGPPGRAAGWSPTLPSPRIGAPRLGAGCAGVEKTIEHKPVQESHKTPISPMGQLPQQHAPGWAGTGREKWEKLFNKQNHQEKILPGSTWGHKKHTGSHRKTSFNGK